MKALALPDGRRLAYEEYGDPTGQPIFLFHGTTQSRLARPDDATTRALGVRLICTDRPGFGGSSMQHRRKLLDWPRDVASLANSLNFEKFSVVGICPYVAACAHEIPERLERVSIVGGMGPLVEYKGLRSLSRDRQAGLLLARSPRLFEFFARRFADPRRDPDAFLDRNASKRTPLDRELIARPEIRQTLIESCIEAARPGLAGLALETRLYTQRWGFRLEDISLPVSLWHGRQDWSAPVELAELVAKKLPRCRAVFPREEGHLILFSQWRAILADLLAPEATRAQ